MQFTDLRKEVFLRLAAFDAVVLIMTERVMDRRLHEPAVVLGKMSVSESGAVEDSGRDKTPFYLPSCTVGSLRVEIARPGRRKFFHNLGTIRLGDRLEAAPAGNQNPLLEGSEPNIFILSSKRRQDAVEAREQAGSKYDINSVMASSEAIEREDASLARLFMEGNEEMLGEQNAQVTKVEIIIEVSE